MKSAFEKVWGEARLALTTQEKKSKRKALLSCWESHDPSPSLAVSVVSTVVPISTAKEVWN